MEKEKIQNCTQIYDLPGGHVYLLYKKGLILMGTLSGKALLLFLVVFPAFTFGLTL